MSWHLHDPGLWLTLGAWVAGAIGAWLVVRGVRGIRLGVTACRSCGYDVTGVVSGVCPECGREPGLARRGRCRTRWLALSLGVVAVGVCVAQRRWVNPLADKIWANFPPRVLVESYTEEGLDWRVYQARGERTEPWPEAMVWDTVAFIRHAELGWVQVNLPEEFVHFGGGGAFTDPTDLNGDGAPEQFLSTWSGGPHCCFTFYIIDSAARTSPITVVEGEHSSPILEDVDHDGVAEIVIDDWSLAYWNWSYAGSPAPRVVLTMRSGVLRPLISAMRKPKREVMDDTEGVTPGSGEEPPQSEEAPYWSLMLDLMYEGNEDQAWEYLDRIWPGDSKAKRQFRTEFLEQLESSKWWPMIRAGYAAEARDAARSDPE
ncbi:MAG: hypothetical protein HEQ23_05435 [Tepidisphaera sp.]